MQTNGMRIEYIGRQHLPSELMLTLVCIGMLPCFNFLHSVSFKQVNFI